MIFLHKDKGLYIPDFTSGFLLRLFQHAHFKHGVLYPYLKCNAHYIHSLFIVL